jgi:N-acetylneuraminic acid mutarotase
LLLILGGEGVSSKRASILYNDLWAFDLRTNSWSELAIENRTVFRPRANFTANIYKNTLYVFGGFVNLNSFKCTDELVTITLNETRQALRQELEYRSSAAAQNTHPVYCAQCRF